MSSTERLQRYLDSEEGSCSEETAAQRLAELEALNATGESASETDIDVLSALANETRYTIVRLLHEAHEELCVCEFAPLLEVSDSAISHSLSQLTEAGLVARRKDGKWRKYRTTTRANALLVALDGSRA